MKKNILILILFIGPMLFHYGAYANEGIDPNIIIKKLNSLKSQFDNEILGLKDEIEILRENQRLNAVKIAELRRLIELNLSNTKQEKKSTKKIQSNSAEKLYSDGKNEFLLENYEKAITLFISFAKSSPNSSNIKDSKLWLARAYFESEKYLKAKDSFLDYQSNNQEHLKFADSMFELARVLDKLNEVSAAKLLLIDMIKQYPVHPLIDKANQLLLDL